MNSIKPCNSYHYDTHYKLDIEHISDLPKTIKFDNYISHHKQNIVKYLDHLQHNNGKLGILLSGSPGTGKTQLVKCIANYLNRPILNIDLRKIKTNRQFFELFVNYSKGKTVKLYEKYVYIFDECDSMPIMRRSNNIENRKLEEKDHQSKLDDLLDTKRNLMKDLISGHYIPSKEIFEIFNFNLCAVQEKIYEFNDMLSVDGVLKVLDGLVSMPKRVIFATTNHPELIDPALLRAGRFDLVLNLEKYNAKEVKDFLVMKYGNNSIIDKLNDDFISDKFTPATMEFISSGTLEDCVKRMQHNDK